MVKTIDKERVLGKIKKKNQLTDLEFDLLKRQILFIIRIKQSLRIML